MKKCISLFLVLLILSFCCTVSAEQNEFTFKTDIHFCDTIDDVKNKDEEVRKRKDRGPYSDFSDKELYPHYLKADDIILADSVVDLFYFFDNDSQLKEIEYEATTYRWDDANLPASEMVSLYDKLFNALTLKYGTQMSDDDIRTAEHLARASTPSAR